LKSLNEERENEELFKKNKTLKNASAFY